MYTKNTPGELYMRHSWGPAMLHILQGYMVKHTSFTIPLLASEVRKLRGIKPGDLSHREVSEAVSDLYNNTKEFEAGWVPALGSPPTKSGGDGDRRQRIWCFVVELRDAMPDMQIKHRYDSRLAYEDYNTNPQYNTPANSGSRKANHTT